MKYKICFLLPLLTIYFFLFTEAKTFVSDFPAPIYLIKSGIIHSNIIFECDAFDEKLQIIKKRSGDMSR